MVANWRLKMATSFSFTLEPKPGIFSSFLSPLWAVLLSMASGT